MGWQKVVCNGCQARVMVAAGDETPDACPDCGEPMAQASTARACSSAAPEVGDGTTSCPHCGFCETPPPTLSGKPRTVWWCSACKRGYVPRAARPVPVVASPPASPDPSTSCTALATTPGTAPAAPSLWEDLKQAAVAVVPHVARGAAIVGAQLLRYKVQEMAERKRAEAVSNHQWAAVGEVARNVGPVAGAGALLGAAAGYLTEGPTGAVRGAVEGGRKGCEIVEKTNPELIREPLRRHGQAADAEVQTINVLSGLADGLLGIVQAVAMGGATTPVQSPVSNGCCPRCGCGGVRRFARGAPGGEYVCNACQIRY